MTDTTDPETDWRLSDPIPSPSFKWFWRTLNISRMFCSFYIGSGGNTYGDVVIWIGPLYISWNYRPFPLEWYTEQIEDTP